MLVLKRRPDQRIILHGGPLKTPIVLTVVDNGPTGVRIGVDAEPEIVVDREEVYERRGWWGSGNGRGG